MSALQAALGLGQLQRLEQLVERKREIFDWYRSELSATGLNRTRPGSASSYWMSTMTWEGGPDKSQVQATLRHLGIDSRPFFHPLSSLPAYAGRFLSGEMKRRNPVSYRLGARGLNLPSALRLTRDDIRETCRAVKQAFR
jgi:perosamine synthetase